MVIITHVKLKQTVETSGFFAAFGIVATVEVQLKNEADNPISPTILMMFGITTTTIVCIYLTSLVMSTYLLPEATVFVKCQDQEVYETPTILSTAKKLSVNFAWILSMICGMSLFFVQLMLIAWVKWWELGAKKHNIGKVSQHSVDYSI